MTTTMGWRAGAAMASPLALALVISCAAKERVYPNGSGGGSSSVTGSSSSSGGGGSGSTGSSTGTGGSPMGKCTPVAQPFDVMTATDVNNSVLSDKPLLIADSTEMHAMVHVVIQDDKHNATFIRTLADDTNVSHNFVQYETGTDGGPAANFSPVEGLATNGQLTLFGTAGSDVNGSPGGVGSLSFNVDPYEGVKFGGQQSLYQQPVECQQGGYMNRLNFAMPQPGVEPRWLGVCSLNQTGYLYAGGESTAPVLINSGDINSQYLQPNLYAVIGGTHLAFFQNNNGPTTYTFGPSLDSSSTFSPIAFNPDMTVLQGLFGALNTPANDGITLLGGYLDMVNTKGQFYGGTIPVGDLDKLGQMIPPAGMKPIGMVTSLAQLGPLFRPLPDPVTQTIVIAGASLSAHSVLFTWLKQDATPILVQKEIYAPDPMEKVSIIAAAASPFGQFSKLVVWVQKDSAGLFSVKGEQFICDMNGG